MSATSKTLYFLGLILAVCPIIVVADEQLGTPDRSTIEWPDDEEPSKLEVQLGKVLFFDPRLSSNQKFSCATCHNPDLGFSDGMASSNGTMGNKLGRATPPVHNLAWASVFFWDGRAQSLEEQALGPIEAKGEMNMPLDKLVERLKTVPWYVDTFKSVYEDGITNDNIGKAIANFERTLISDNSAFDKYIQGNLAAMQPAAVRGLKLFKGKANCIQCHSGPNFTDDSFHNIGVSGSKDPGRAKVVDDKTLTGAFKTPGLRNVALRGPYMHNGSERSLEDVIRLYNVGGKNKKNLSSLIKPLKLTEQEIMDLVAFMGALTDVIVVERPQIP